MRATPLGKAITPARSKLGEFWTNGYGPRGLRHSWASDSNGAKNNELGSEPWIRGVGASRNPSPALRFEKTHSRVVIESPERGESAASNRSPCDLSESVVCESPRRGRSLFFAPLLSDPRERLSGVPEDPDGAHRRADPERSCMAGRSQGLATTMSQIEETQASSDE